jgi:hypothetical protein
MARYIKKGTPVGRPKVYLDATERPTRLTASVPVELYTQLAQAAAAQHISLSGLMVQALERYLHTPALSSPSSQTIDVAAIDADLTQALEALADLEQAIGDTITPAQDATLRPHFDRVFQLFLALGDALHGLKGSSHANHA